MIFKYNSQNPRLKAYYREELAKAKRDADFTIKFWLSIVVIWGLIFIVSLGIMSSLTIMAEIKIANTPGFVVPKVVNDVVIRLSVIFLISFILFILTGLRFRMARFARLSLEPYLNREGII